MPQFEEIIDHFISGCPMLAKEQYLKRHDRYGRKRLKLVNDRWHEKVPRLVEKKS
jgi:hypothetical protein